MDVAFTMSARSITALIDQMIAHSAKIITEIPFAFFILPASIKVNLTIEPVLLIEQLNRKDSVLHKPSSYCSDIHTQQKSTEG